MHKRIAFVAAAVATWLYAGGSAWAIDLLGGDFKLSGFAFNESSVATDGGLHRDRPFSAGYRQGDLERMRWSVQLEGDLKLIRQMADFRNVGIFAIGRYARQTETEVDNAIPSPDKFGIGRGDVRTFNGHKYFEDLTLREAYIYSDLTGLPGGDGFVSIGKQQVVWGESDGFRLADIVNPLDLSWHFFLEPFPDIRQTMPLLRFFYYPNMLKGQSVRLETVWTWDFESTDFAPVYCNFTGSPTDRRKACPPGGAVPGAFWNFGFDQTAVPINNKPDGFPSAGAIGERVTFKPTDFGPLTDYEISVYDYYRHYDFPVANNHRSDGSFQFSYPSQNVMGVTFNRFYSDFLFWKDANIVFRGEGTYTDKFPLTGRAGELVKRSAFKWVMGFDRPTDLPWWAGDFGKLMGISPEGRTTFLAVQWFQTYIAHEKQGESGPETGPRQWPTIVTFYAGQRWLTGEELQPGIFIAYEEPQGNILYQPSVSYRYGNYLIFGLTYNMFESFSGGKRRDGFFGPFLQRDELMGKVTFQF